MPRFRLDNDKKVSLYLNGAIDPRVLIWGEIMRRHGVTTVPFAHEFSKHLYKNVDAAGRRMNDLRSVGLVRHLNPSALNHFALYDLTRKYENVLKTNERWYDNTPLSSNSPAHDLMRSFVTQSIHIATLQPPPAFEYIHHDVIANRIGRNSFPLNPDLKPDCFFGIKYHSGAIVYALEVNKTKKAEAYYLKRYHHLIAGKEYHQYFWPGARLMVVSIFDNEAQKNSMMRKAASLYPNGIRYHLFGHLAGFECEPLGSFPPPRPFPEIFFEPLERVGHPPFSLAEPPDR